MCTLMDKENDDDDDDYDDERKQIDSSVQRPSSGQQHEGAKCHSLNPADWFQAVADYDISGLRQR